MPPTEHPARPLQHFRVPKLTIQGPSWLSPAELARPGQATVSGSKPSSPPWGQADPREDGAVLPALCWASARPLLGEMPNEGQGPRVGR